ncbi:MAG: STM4012 family radical SAM protein [Verrucomicrobiales bacterium]
MTKSLEERMLQGGYDGYAYGYPHKTSYRQLEPPVPLKTAWANEDKSNLFLYTHLPFCEMRCGFCNLFTTAQPGSGLVEQTLAAIKRQSGRVAEAIKPLRIAQAAFGGGTPSFLSEGEIESLFKALEREWPIDWSSVPVSFEVSPGTITPNKLQSLKGLGVDRISMGVQSFVPEDLIAMKRPQPAGQLEAACDLIKRTGFAVFNIDLIYGAEGQDALRWKQSLERALEWLPEELYLYPLYIRKLTKLDRTGKKPGEHRRDLYRQARDILTAAGYRQISMRFFRRADIVRHTDYCCQEDGMVGLGPGARSYTDSLHYSSEYAVGQTEVRGIISKFNALEEDHHAFAHYGTILDGHEMRLRYVIKSLLRAEGVNYMVYQERFGSELFSDVPQLQELLRLGLASDLKGTLLLTEDGFAWSDTIGPWLYSDAVTEKMDAFEFA